MDTVEPPVPALQPRIGSDIRFIGIPKTIDNDLILTDHTPGLRQCCPLSWLPPCGRFVLDACGLRQSEICHHRGDHGTPRRLAHSCLKAGKKI